MDARGIDGVGTAKCAEIAARQKTVGSFFFFEGDFPIFKIKTQLPLTGFYCRLLLPIANFLCVIILFTTMFRIRVLRFRKLTLIGWRRLRNCTE